MADPRHSEPSIVETTTEAREGSTPGMTRYVLIFGTLLVVILFLVIFLAGRP
jgi:cobalamin biosynthesis Mg chelatase CobN